MFCKNRIIGYRWVCLSCRPGKITNEGLVDICNSCMRSLRIPKTPECEKVVNILAEEGHVHRRHIFFRVALGSGNYWKY